MINNMKKYFLMIAAIIMAGGIRAQMTPIYYEGFSKCYDEEDEHYGYTGGNDGQWGGDIATAIVVYQDAPEWDLDYCNGAYQCLKVGTSTKQGSATTPKIGCEGEAVLSFRAAPWEGDSIMMVLISGGTAQDPTSFELKKHQWTDITIRIADITDSIQVTFTSYSKHRFFIDEVYVRPADPTVGVIRVPSGTTVDFGYVGYNYTSSSRTVVVEGANLTGNITATLENGETSLFALSSSTLPATGGTLTVSTKTGASADMHGCYLYLRGEDQTTHATVEKRVTIMLEVGSIALQGSGTKPDPYTCQDVVILAAHEGTVWNNTYYWVTGYVLGGVKRYNDQYDGISMTDNLSLVLADNPNETNESKYVTVQISENARAALNVVDNPELVGQQIKVQGTLLKGGSNPSPYYLGKPGVRDVRTDAQYVKPGMPESLEFRGLEIRGRKLIVDGQVLIEMSDGNRYNVLGTRVR